MTRHSPTSADLAAFRRAIARSHHLPAGALSGAQASYNAMLDGRESQGIGWADHHTVVVPGVAEAMTITDPHGAGIIGDGAGVATYAEAGAWWAFLLRQGRAMTAAGAEGVEAA